MLSVIVTIGSGVSTMPWWSLVPLVPGLALLVVLRRLTARPAPRALHPAITSVTPDDGGRVAA